MRTPAQALRPPRLRPEAAPAPPRPGADRRGGSRRPELRGMDYKGACAALAPGAAHAPAPRECFEQQRAALQARAGRKRNGPQRLQDGLRKRLADQAPSAITSDELEGLVSQATEALNQISAGSTLASAALSGASHAAQAAEFAEFAKQAAGTIGRVGKIAGCAATVASLVELAIALKDGDLVRAGDVAASGLVNAVLLLNPFTAIPAAILTLCFGSDWPTQLAHHLADAAGLHDMPKSRIRRFMTAPQ